ncbi:hypothetical protein Btru_031435 [Bulinus truncatus]|nr:hypothetical protein Btru_031435 [Bulinus truncatus]
MVGEGDRGQDLVALPIVVYRGHSKYQVSPMLLLGPVARNGWSTCLPSLVTPQHLVTADSAHTHTISPRSNNSTLKAFPLFGFVDIGADFSWETFPTSFQSHLACEIYDQQGLHQYQTFSGFGPTEARATNLQKEALAEEAKSIADPDQTVKKSGTFMEWSREMAAVDDDPCSLTRD